MPALNLCLSLVLAVDVHADLPEQHAHLLLWQVSMHKGQPHVLDVPLEQ